MYNNVKANKSQQQHETKGRAVPLPLSAKEGSFVNQSSSQASGRDFRENGLTPTSARFNHLSGQPHISVSKISGSFDHSNTNGVSGPGSWMRMNGGLRSPNGMMGQVEFKGR